MSESIKNITSSFTVVFLTFERFICVEASKKIFGSSGCTTLMMILAFSSLLSKRMQFLSFCSVMFSFPEIYFQLGCRLLLLCRSSKPPPKPTPPTYTQFAFHLLIKEVHALPPPVCTAFYASNIGSLPMEKEMGLVWMGRHSRQVWLRFKVKALTPTSDKPIYCFWQWEPRRISYCWV